MGIIDRAIQRRIDKALSGIGMAPSPAAGVTSDVVSLIEGLARGDYGGGVNTRDPQNLPWDEPTTPFPVGRPIAPVGIDPRLPDTDRPMPRKMENPIGWNLPGQGNRVVPWTVLRTAADQVDAMRLCIGVRKKELTSVGWSIAVKEEMVQSLAQQNKTSNGRARAQAQNDYASEIQRLTSFWERPDKISRLTFTDWFGMLVEEQLVLDAVSIYPHPALDGTLHSLELLDGSTIKPLMDHGGRPPQPPQPAYQQMLWGFPRGEFTLTEENVPGVAGAMSSDQLIYRPRERRTFTLYGFSPVEQALIAADLYLKRQEWLRSEYTDGAIPAGLMVPPEALKWTPDQVRQYEANINSELAGQTQQRMRWRLTPPGVTTEFPANFAERYNNEFDEYLIKLLCAFFDVMPSEIGFVQKGGLGGAGHQQGEAASGARKGNNPFLEWAADIFNDINQQVLGAPPELTFVFDLDESEDYKTKADVAKSDIGVGKRTINDTRAEDGLPLYDIPEADEPMVITPQGPVFLKGLLEQHEASTSASIAGSQHAEGIATGDIEDPAVTAAKLTGPPPAPDDEASPVDKETSPAPEKAPTAAQIKKSSELRAFKRYARGRGDKEWRDFRFDSVDVETAAELNKAAQAGEPLEPLIEKAAHPKGRARKGPGYASHRNLVKHYSARISQALLDSIGDLDHFVQQHMDARIVKATGSGLPLNKTPLADALTELHTQAWHAGVMDAKDQLGEAVSWDTWEPGNIEAADKLSSGGLRELLAGDDVTIKSVLDTQLDQLGNLIADGVASGDSVDTIARDIRSTLADGSRASMVANTEVNRAMSSATLDTYRSASVQKVDWLLSLEPCELCEENADAGPIDIDDDWPNGDPPVHPNCECSLAPSGDPDDWTGSGTDEDGLETEETTE